MTLIRAGVLVPPANPTVEPELRALLPPSVFAYVARLTGSGDLRQRMADYRSDAAALGQLSGLGLAGALIACTGASYPIGAEGDRAWSQDAAEHLGAPVVTAAGALVQALAALRATRVTLVSPYPEWLTDQCQGFWEDAGVTIVRVWRLEGSGAIYDTAPTELGRLIESTATASVGAADAVMVAGTGAASLGALDDLAGSQVPIVSSMVAGAWALCRLVGAAPHDSRSPALRRLSSATEAVR